MDKTKLYGVAGWLKFFLITFAIISPLVALFATHGVLLSLEYKVPELLNNSSWMYYKVFAWILLFIAIMLQLKVSYDLKTKFIPASVYNVKLLLIILPIGMTIWDQLALLILFNTSSFDLSIPALIKQLIANGIWVIYFTVSKRVKNTYYPINAEAIVNKQSEDIR